LNSYGVADEPNQGAAKSNDATLGFNLPDPATIDRADIHDALIRLASVQNILLARLSEPATAPAQTDVGLLDAKAVGALLAIPVAAVWKYKRLGIIGHVKVGIGKRGKPPRGVRFTQAMVDAFVAARSKAASVSRSR